MMHGPCRVACLTTPRGALACSVTYPLSRQCWQLPAPASDSSHESQLANQCLEQLLTRIFGAA